MKTLFFVFGVLCLACSPDAVSAQEVLTIPGGCDQSAPDCYTIAATICDPANATKCYKAFTLKGKLCGPAKVRITKDDPPALELAPHQCVPADPSYKVPEVEKPGRWRVHTGVGNMGGWFILELDRWAMLCGVAVVTTPESVTNIDPGPDCLKLGHKKK